jgi:hypothetical protein
MRYIKLLFFLLAVVFSIVAQADSKASDFCKVTDANGKVTFKKCIYRKSKPKTPEPTSTPPSSKPAAPKVDIYYASWDPNSNKAILFFREKHIVVNAFDIEHDPEAAARKKRIDPNFVGMPLVIINGVVIRGVDEKKYREALAIKPQ